MNVPVNIQAIASQPATAGKTALKSASDATGEDLGALFATLMELTTAETSAAQTAADVAQQSATPPQISSIDPTTTTESLDTMVAGLIDLLTQMQTAIEADNPLDQELATKITDSLNALTAKLNANTALTTPPSAPGDGKMGDAALARLTAFAGQFAEGAPQLAAKLDELTQKLAQIAPPATTAATADTPEVEAAKILAAALGKNNGETKETPLSKSMPSSGVSDQADRMLGRSELTFAAQASADARANQATARSNDTNLAGSLSAAALASGPSKTEKSAPIDPLLIVQTTGQPATKADFSAAIKPMTAAYQPQAPQLNMPHIAFEMARQFKDGASRFQIRMDPPEMGRIDVKMDVDGTGNIHARLTVERAETLDLLQRDARALERALAQAGLDGARTNLEFSLRQNPFARQEGQAGDPNFGHDSPATTTADGDPNTDVPPPYIYRGTASPGGINMYA